MLTNPRLALRLAIVAEWVFVVLTIIGSFVFERWLPQPLQDWVAAETNRTMTALEIASMVIGMGSMLLWLVGSIALMCLKKWGAWLFLASHVVGSFSTVVSNASVSHPFTGLCDDWAMLLWGVVLGIAFFSSALESPRAPAPPPVPFGVPPVFPPA